MANALIKAKPRSIYDPRRRLQLQGRSGRGLIAYGDAADEAYLEFHPGSRNTLLKVKRERYHYREHGTGVADLTLLDRAAPDIVCLSLPRDSTRITQLVEHDYEPFYLKHDPFVRSLRNVQRLGRPGLLITLVPIWAEANWAYSNGGERWLG